MDPGTGAATIETGAPTLLDTHEQIAPPLPNLPDPPWVYEYRGRVCDALRALSVCSEYGWPKRVTAMFNCGRAGILVQCKECGARHIVPYRCGARTCPPCARRAAAAIADRVLARARVHDLLMEVEPWDGPGRVQKRGWRFITLTTRALGEVEDRFDPRILRQRVLEVRKAASRFWRRTPWGAQTRDLQSGRKRARRDTSYVLAVEIAPGGMVHAHLAVYGEYVSQSQLQAVWGETLGEKAWVDVRAVRGPRGVCGALREVLKYATKGETDRRTQAVHAAAVEVAFRGVKRISIGGALRKVRIDDAAAGVDDARPEDLHDTRQLECECGSVGAWSWEGFVDPRTVRFNGGYGPVGEDVQAYLEGLAERRTGVE